MRVPTLAIQRGLQFNMTPLIDIVFLLIIFFLVASHFAKSETSLDVELPEASAQEDEQPQSPHRVIVTITAAEEFFLGPEKTDIGQIEQVIRQTKQDAGEADVEVQIYADRRATYRPVEPILLACAKFGIRQFKVYYTSPTR